MTKPTDPKPKQLSIPDLIRQRLRMQYGLLIPEACNHAIEEEVSELKDWREIAEKLNGYADHDGDCFLDRVNCKCGLSDLIKQLEKLRGGG